MIRPACRRQASLKNARSSAARVPTTTHRAPVSRAESTARRSRSPPPTSTGTGIMAATIFVTSALCRGSPANAPSRSTTCRRSAPSFFHWSATATGSSENTVSRSARPWCRRTHRPSRRSIAGMTITVRPSRRRRSSRGDGGPTAGSSRDGTGSRRPGRARSPPRIVRRSHTTPRAPRPLASGDAQIARPEPRAPLSGHPRSKPCSRPRYDRIVRVDEVEASARGDAVEQPEVPGVLHAVPSHVGNLRPGRQTAHGTGDDVEPSSLAELLTGGKQELIAEADPQERPAAIERPAEGGQQAQAVEVRHRVVKRAVPRQHHRLRVVDSARILGDHCRAADATKRLLDGPEVSAPVVDDGNHSAPFVEGSTPAILGLTRVASASARPTALNTASVMWWRLWP